MAIVQLDYLSNQKQNKIGSTMSQTHIQVIGPNTYYTESRGNKMTLTHNPDLNLWEMVTDNACARAYNYGRASMPKVFHSLKDVEQKYKSWRGISALVDELSESPMQPLS